MASSLGVCIPGRMCTGGGIHYRGCTFITGGVASTSAASTTGGCTFITGGVHTRTHVYWGWHPLQEVYLHNWGVASTSAASTTGGCTFIAGGGWHPPVLHPLQGGVPSSLGVCIPGCMCTGVASTTWGVPSLLGGWHPPVLHPLQGDVPSSMGVCIPGCMCTGGGIHYRGCTFITGGVASTSAASTTGGCTFITGGVHTRIHVYWGCTFIATSQKYLLT